MLDQIVHFSLTHKDSGMVVLFLSPEIDGDHGSKLLEKNTVIFALEEI